jgi:hypothetical protein
VVRTPKYYLEKINEAKEKALKELDFRGSGLRQIPPRPGAS